jgi:hypothetical protein
MPRSKRRSCGQNTHSSYLFLPKASVAQELGRKSEVGEGWIQIGDVRGKVRSTAAMGAGLLTSFPASTAVGVGCHDWRGRFGRRSLQRVDLGPPSGVASLPGGEIGLGLAIPTAITLRRILAQPMPQRCEIIDLVTQVSCSAAWVPRTDVTGAKRKAGRKPNA